MSLVHTCFYYYLREVLLFLNVTIYNCNKLQRWLLMEQQMHGGHRPVLRPDRGRVVQNFLPSGGTWWRESVHADRSPATF